MSRLVPAVLLVACIGFSSAVRADPVPATVRFAWVRGDGAEGCPDGAAMRQEVTRRLRRDPFDDDGPRSIEAVVERGGEVWRAVLRVRDTAGALLGERTLSDPATACTSIADASALAIALAVDPDAVIDVPAPSTPPRPPTRVRRAPQRVQVVEVRNDGPRFSLGLVGGFNAGITTLTATVGVAGTAEFSRTWSLRLAMDLAPSQPASDPTLSLGFTRVSLLGCLAPWKSARFDLALCLGVSGALVHAAVRSGRALDGGDAPWLGANAVASLRWFPSESWFLALQADAAAAIVRNAFRYRPDDTVIFEQPVFSGGASLAVGLRVP